MTQHSIYDFVYNFSGFNKTIFIFLNQITNSGNMPQILQLISAAFSLEKFALYYFITALYFYCKLKNHPQAKILFLPVYYKLVEIGMTYALFGFLYAALKFGINLPRPFCSLPQEDFITILNIAKERCLSSFPSAHTGLAVLSSYYIWPYLQNYQKIIAILLVAAVTLSRITLAMHYPADILYSLVITTILIFLNRKLFNHLKNFVITPVGNLLAKWFYE